MEVQDFPKKRSPVFLNYKMIPDYDRVKYFENIGIQILIELAGFFGNPVVGDRRRGII